MSAAGLRTGFLMRGFLPLGPLTVSRGLGGWGTQIIGEAELEEAVVPGFRDVRAIAQGQRAPRTLLRRKKTTTC